MTKRKTVKGKKVTKEEAIALDIEALKKIPGIHVMELGEFSGVGPEKLHNFLAQHLGEAVAAGKTKVTREEMIAKLDSILKQVAKTDRDDPPNFGLVALHYGEGPDGAFAINATHLGGDGQAAMIVNLVSALFDRIPENDRLSLLFDLCGRERMLGDEDQELYDECEEGK